MFVVGVVGVVGVAGVVVNVVGVVGVVGSGDSCHRRMMVRQCWWLLLFE